MPSAIDDYVRLLDDPSAIVPGLPKDAALQALLVHVAFGDGVVTPDELAFLERCMPYLDPAEILVWASEVAARPLDLDGLARELETEADRFKALVFAVRMAWTDGEIADRERVLLDELASGLGLPASSVEEALGAVRRTLEAPLAMDRLAEAFSDVPREAPPEDLVDLVPPGARALARFAIGPVLLCDAGIAASFVEGRAFLAWAEVASYTRVPVRGTALQLVTWDRQTFSIADPRAKALGELLDRILEA